MIVLIIFHFSLYFTIHVIIVHYYFITISVGTIVILYLKLVCHLPNSYIILEISCQNCIIYLQTKLTLNIINKNTHELKMVLRVWRGLKNAQQCNNQ